MIVAKKIGVMGLFLMFISYGQLYAQTADGYNEDRGKLLYAIHCITCHDTEVHWRAKKHATDWQTLVQQVNRWQYNLTLDWNENDIADVAGYLNAVYYHFPVVQKTGQNENDQPLAGTVRE